MKFSLYFAVMGDCARCALSAWHWLHTVPSIGIECVGALAFRYYEYYDDKIFFKEGFYMYIVVDLVKYGVSFVSEI